MTANKAQSIAIKLSDGKICKMDFDMGALANAECIYEKHFGKAVGVNAMIADLVQGKAHAVMAFAYGAIQSADQTITWQDFCKSVFTFENYQKLTDTVADAIATMMRSDAEPEDGDAKNASSRGEN